MISSSYVAVMLDLKFQPADFALLVGAIIQSNKGEGFVKMIMVVSMSMEIAALQINILLIVMLNFNYAAHKMIYANFVTVVALKIFNRLLV